MHRTGRTRDAGIVDQAIESAQMIASCIEQPGDLSAVRHIAHRPLQPIAEGRRRLEIGNRSGIDLESAVFNGAAHCFDTARVEIALVAPRLLNFPCGARKRHRHARSCGGRRHSGSDQIWS